MFGKFLVLLGMYSKTSSLTQADRLIAHGVDALTSGILIHFLTFIRPFVQVLVSESFSLEAYPGIHDMYDNFLFVDYDKLFTTERLSSIMEEYTDRFLSVPLSISHWRHVSIGFQKAHCRSELHAVTDIGEGDRVSAEQAGHSLALENRMYALSADGIEGTPGREMHLFCNVSVAYQTVTRVVPSGIQLPYRECMPKEFQALVDRGLIVLPRDRKMCPEDVIANKVFELLQPYIGKVLDAHQGRYFFSFFSFYNAHTRVGNSLGAQPLQHVGSIPPSPIPGESPALGSGNHAYESPLPADKPHEDDDELEYVDNPALLAQGEYDIFKSACGTKRFPQSQWKRATRKQMMRTLTTHRGQVSNMDYCPRNKPCSRSLARCSQRFRSHRRSSIPPPQCKGKGKGVYPVGIYRP